MKIKKETLDLSYLELIGSLHTICIAMRVFSSTFLDRSEVGILQRVGSHRLGNLWSGMFSTVQFAGLHLQCNYVLPQTFISHYQCNPKLIGHTFSK